MLQREHPAQTKPAASARQLVAFRFAFWLLWIPAIAACYVGSREHGPELRASLVVALALLLNAALLRSMSRAQVADIGSYSWTLTFDLLAHTLVLSFLGGVSNPAVLLYFPLVAIAGLLLPRPWIALFAGFAGAAHGVLLHYALPLPAALALGLEPRGQAARLVLWIGFCASLALTAFVAEAWRRAVAREHELFRVAHDQAAQHASVAMATSLAAGAAHELGGPLATIAVASHEMQRTIATDASVAAFAADTQLIAQEVKRARRVLDRLAAAEIVDPCARELVEVGVLKAELLQALEEPSRLHIEASTNHLLIHRIAVVTMLLSLIRNAMSASSPSQVVELAIARKAGELHFAVRDRGIGMTSEVMDALGKPFVRGNHQRHGFGLGVFLANVIAQQVDAELHYTSNENGTCAQLRLRERVPTSDEVSASTETRQG